MTIKELRIKRGYRTQEEFANDCGVSRPTIANIEQDPKKLYSVKLGTIIVICEKLKVRPDQLLKMAKGNSMVFVRQQNTWFASGKFVGSYIDKKTNKVINGTAIIYPYKYTNVFLWTTNNDVKKQILSLKKDDQVLAWGEVKFRKTTSKPLFVAHAIMKAPVPNISLKEENGLDIEYAKYLEQMNDINLDDFANKDD